MGATVRRVPFQVDALEGAIAFALANPLRPFHPARQMRRFLGKLISSDKLVIDVQDDKQQRVACAVLMDNLQNPSNSASLVIIGFDRAASGMGVYDLIVREAKSELPARKAGIELDFCDDCPVDLKFLEDRGFKPYYTMYEMLKQDERRPSSTLPDGYRLRGMTPDDLPEYHRVLSLAFAGNLETSIPSLEEMATTLPGPIPATLLLHHNQIVGFFNISIAAKEGDSGEINTLGLLSSYRGQGLGRLLLDQAVDELARRNVDNFKVTVAAGNETALGLYKRAGFQILNRYLCLRYPQQV